MPESENNPETTKPQGPENDNKTEAPENISTDDYFEKVNLRLKKKSRFGFNSPKKTEAPKDEHVPMQNKVELPQNKPETQIQNIEAINKEQPIVDEIKKEQVVNNGSETVIESDNKPIQPEKIVEKKRGFFGFRRNRNKVPSVDEKATIESSMEKTVIDSRKSATKN